MQKIIITIIVLLIFGFGIYYFTSNNNSNNVYNYGNMNGNTSQTTPITNMPVQNNNTTPVTPPTKNETVIPNPTPTAPSSVSINIANFSFSPQNVSIKTGTKVTWTNNDSVPHTVTSDTGLFDSKNLSSGQSFSYTFNTPGSINYHCNIHTMMKGSIIVQ